MDSWLNGICRLVAITFVTLPMVDRVYGQETRPSIQLDKKRVDFALDVFPILESHCISCHGSAKQESNFRLDVKSRALGTGDYGDPPIVPGNSSESPLIEFVSDDDADLTMPPEGEGTPLTTDQVQILKDWIDQGADWPNDLAGEVATTKISTDHWAFQPVRQVVPPNLNTSAADRFPLRNGIDHFVASKLEANAIQPSEPAGRVELIRRIYLNMHGLLPTPEQVQDFVNDPSEESIAKVVDDVLASRHYGERWARHWLDVVRFGESTGYEVNRDRANAFYYRDYVIDAFNNDKPYSKFVIEQIAGDAVGADEATGFLVGGPHDIVKSPDINLTLMQREDELADYVNTTSTAFLALTVGCARCHNHKFDPILQRDYYALQAVFAGVVHGERQLASKAEPGVLDSLQSAKTNLRIQEAKLGDLRALAPKGDDVLSDLLPMVNAVSNVDSFDSVEAKFVRFSIQTTNQSEPCIDEFEIYTPDGTNVALASSGSLASSSGNYQGDPKHQLDHVNDGKYGNPFSWIANSQEAWVQIELPRPIEINRVVWARDRNGKFADRLATRYSIEVSSEGKDWQVVAGSNQRKPFLIDGQEAEDAFIARLPNEHVANAKQVLETIIGLRDEVKSLEQSIPIGYVGTFKVPSETRRLYRGDPMAPREAVLPDTLEVMGTLGMQATEQEQSRRLKLAKWIASDKNPLTARVIVNRVWHYHFGQGIVPTPSDFGKNGIAPSHPELLDWLAHQFMANGWSLKWLHREILLSSTFQQSSRPRSAALAKDADCRWLWRFPPRRLEAEAIRDCVLQLTGQLNLKAGGPGFLLFRVDRENVHHYFPLENFAPKHFRRMIYMTKIRQEQDEVFGAFDCPDGGQSIPNRSRSTTALQALNLLNSKFMIEQTEFLAMRLAKTSGTKPSDQVRLAFDLAFSREPNSDELRDAVSFIEQHGLEAFCRAMLNANEFLFVS